MKTILMLGLSFMLIITASACGTQNAPVEKQKPAEVQASANTQTNPAPIANKAETQIKITPPSGWNPVAGSVLPVQYQKNTASFMVKKEPFQGKNLDDVLGEAKKAFEKSFDKVRYDGDAQSLTVDGQDARKIVFTGVVSGMNMKYECVYLFKGKDVYVITFGDLANTFDALSADYKQILADIRFE